ncbi:hypothetical protein MVES1_002930 [Malassezia vespertilionis]|uniref:uncharacterized protein n=1 Tax=Malassezia vespertilionis TaxID=2020962 RepID=UPI0024B15664|nr:uncharacterized protein MVES1_002930 [Malassezia vespertilionis]WFD07563.1 hypothetical protein MVES1_002930 [Malassezia vespertilionis]
MGILQQWRDGFKPAETGYGKDVNYTGDFVGPLGEKPDILGDDEYANTTSVVQADDGHVEYVPQRSPLKRRLEGRHIQFIALGGGIGTGLFIGSGHTLNTGGPAFLVVDFIIVSVMLICMVFALGELAAVLPVSGAFSTYASRFVDHSWGFAVGWIYYLQWLVIAPLEFTASVIIIEYWDTRGIWIMIFILVLTAINFFGVRGYAEFEFCATFLKVITVIILIIVLIVIDCGGSPSGNYLGAHTWHDPGPINNGFKGFCSVFTTAAFAFAGTELVGLAAAETKEPRKVLPKAATQIVFRIVVFYVLSLFLVSLVVPYDDPALTGGSSSYDPRQSPFVVAVNIGGLKNLAHFVNAIIIVSTLSVANSAIYAGSRTLQALAEHGHAPKVFKYVDREGRPLYAVILSLAFGALAFVMYAGTDTEETVFAWLLGISGLSNIFSWASICLCHIRFRAAWRKQGYTLRQLPWKSPLGVYGSIVGLVINILVIAANVYVSAFPPGEGTMTPHDRAFNFFENSLSLPVIIVFYVVHKIIYRSPFARTENMDIHTGRREEVDEELLEQERAEARARPLAKKIFGFVF